MRRTYVNFSREEGDAIVDLSGKEMRNYKDIIRILVVEGLNKRGYQLPAPCWDDIRDLYDNSNPNKRPG